MRVAAREGGVRRMVYLIRGQNCLSAWQEGVRHLAANGGEEHHLIVEIEDPVYRDPAWYSDYNAKQIVPAAKPLRDVVSTIFPIALARRSISRQQLYGNYTRYHQRAKRRLRNRGTWGTYFERLTAFGPRQNNQLESAIGKLIRWNQRYTTPFVFHFSSPEMDPHRPMGGPCLQYAQILWYPNDVLDLYAVYRNHDYFRKALGNFIGLGALLEFVAQETNKTPRKLVVHAAHAYSESSISSLRRLARV